MDLARHGKMRLHAILIHSLGTKGQRVFSNVGQADTYEECITQLAEHFTAPKSVLTLKMRGVFAGWTLVPLLLVAVWADTYLPHQHDHQHRHDGEIHCHRLSAPNADFAFDLYKRLNSKTTSQENIFYSPLGISTVLSMLSTGARGETHSQVFSTLGYSAFNQTEVNEAYQHLFQVHGHRQKHQQLDVGNAAVLRSGFDPLETFLKAVKHYYSGEVFSVNMAKPQEATANINEYIANKTQGKIRDMVRDLDPSMAMVLINYVYFKGEWQKPFNPTWTQEADFTVNDFTKVRVDMMTRTGHYKTYWDIQNHTTIVMLPYEGKSSMMIVLPNKDKMNMVEETINKDYIQHWKNSVSMRYVDLSLPKFSISTEISLETTLKEMGIINAFEDNADFTGISDQIKIKVSKASHKTVLSVTETGTEAAAATFTEFMYLTLPPSITVDRPFLVFILESSTDSIMFMGKINNPTAM
ncbi:alpha-1-antitrypsin homolog [Pholidichthys leucotaenia]